MRDAEDLDFAGGGGARLAGALHLPPADGPGGGAWRGALLLAHCFTCSKDLHTTTRLARGLAAAGYAILRFDFTGLGASGGNFSATTLSHNVDDLERALDVLAERAAEHGPCGMVGHSFGGVATLLTAARRPAEGPGAVRSVAVLGAPSSPGHIRGLVDECDGAPVATVAGRRFPLDPGFVADLDRHEPRRAATELDRPLLVLHAVDDAVVGVGEGEALFAAARQPKAFVPLLGADHLLSSRRSADQAARVLADWFDRTL